MFFRYLQHNAKEKIAFQAKNTKIFHHLRYSLAKVSRFSASNLLSPYWILVYSTLITPQIYLEIIFILNLLN